MRRTLTALAAVLCIGLLGACGSSSADDEGNGDGYQAGQTHDPYQVDGTPLTDTDGAPYSLVDDTDNDLTLVFFGYSECPDVCQVVMSNLSSAMTRLDEADRERVDVVFVTTDPARDTPEVLRRYLDTFDPSFIGLSSDLDTIIEVGKPLAVFVDKGEKLPSGGWDVGTHSSQITAITPDDTSPLLWTQDTSSADLAADIHTMLNEG